MGPASAVPPEPTLTEPDTATTIGASNNPDSGDISKASSEPEPGATITTTVQASDRAVTSSEGEKEQEQEVSVQARPPSETGARPKATDRGSPSDDQEEIRKRRLAVFEAQKKRLMNKNK